MADAWGGAAGRPAGAVSVPEAEPLLELLAERCPLPGDRLGVPCPILGAGDLGQLVRRCLRLGRCERLYVLPGVAAPELGVRLDGQVPRARGTPLPLLAVLHQVLVQPGPLLAPLQGGPGRRCQLVVPSRPLEVAVPPGDRGFSIGPGGVGGCLERGRADLAELVAVVPRRPGCLGLVRRPYVSHPVACPARPHRCRSSPRRPRTTTPAPKRGYEVVLDPPGDETFGHAQVIRVTPEGLLSGAADPRAGDAAF